MSSFVFTFGSVKSLILVSIFLYLLAMFYFHSRISNEDFRISRLERLASERMPPKKDRIQKLPDDLFVDSDGIIKANVEKPGARKDGGILIAKRQGSKNAVVSQHKHEKKGPPKGRSRKRKQNKDNFSERGKEEIIRRFPINEINSGSMSELRRTRKPEQLQHIKAKNKLQTTTKGKGPIFYALLDNNSNSHGMSVKPYKENNNIGRLPDSANEVRSKYLNNTRDTDKSRREHQIRTGNRHKEQIGQTPVPSRKVTKKWKFHEVISNVFVFAAYLDDRDGRYLRFVSIAETNSDRTEPFICHFHSGRFSAGKFYQTCESHRRPYAAFIISCPVPETENVKDISKTGVVISNSTNLKTGYVRIEVVSSQKQKSVKTFNVCVPPLFGNVSDDKLIEFIEVSKILGAEHFTFYAESFTLNRNLTKVLNMYRRNGEISLIPWQLPIDNDEIWYHGQSVSVWDCLFRNLNHFKYIVFNDIDEFIIPKENKNWRLMINKLKSSEKDSNTIAAFRFQSAIFDNRGEAIPSFAEEVKSLVTLNTVWRNEFVDKIRTKMIIDPYKVFEIGIHHLSKPLNDKYIAFNVDPQVALLHHYKKCENRPRMSCRKSIQDFSVWRFYSEIVENVTKVKSILTNVRTKGV